ncbi:hypothetical protein [Vibrio navarrensis]|uniref:Restriction endonuclease n=1 Tax=Vibrio navarrensis TaxID=29495 RepID=A0AAJ4IA98_9VIBR|nr:hypothetical protein I3X05_14685 [Vibrio navarrensis]
MGKKFKHYDHEDAVAARDNVINIIDEVEPEDLVNAIKRAPSLRGMILGYIAEEMFEKHVLEPHQEIDDVRKHDDHDRENNKIDRDFVFNGRRYTIQNKSIQTNSICWNDNLGSLSADVQNDASDKRPVTLPNGNVVETTNYKRGDYDILAVPLFPFTGKWDFAYKRNRDCRLTTSKKYSTEDQQYLLATTEVITYPLSEEWTTDIEELLDDSLGQEIDEE